MGRNKKTKQKKTKKRPSGARSKTRSLLEVRFETALAHDTAGRIDQARAAYGRLLGRDPGNAQVMYHLGVLLARSGRQAQALEILQKAAETAPEVAAVHLSLGNLFYLQGRMEEALGAFDRARNLAPEMTEVHAGMASVHHRLRQPEAAILALERAVALAPTRADLVTNLANTLHRQQRTDEAVAVLQAAVARIPNNATLGHQLASLSGQATPTAPAQFVRETFDRLSSTFDRHLRDDLGYRTPEALRDLLSATVPEKQNFARMVDLGCGTGLSGEAFQSLARHITGIDLSEKMLALARDKGVYHELHCSGIVEALWEQSPPFDLFVAADVLVYMGDLSPLFQAIRQRSAPGALFLFSTESGTKKDWTLQTTGRYAHHLAYVQRLCQNVGFDLLAHRQETLRKEKGAWVMGDLFMVRRKEAAQ
ncbi:MAG: tetratricopeptide repeat protein [Desulfobacterales bacterium]|nr:tetratricopeptide repeat protein [Desulfobacterales bacterium]